MLSSWYCGFYGVVFMKILMVIMIDKVVVLVINDSCGESGNDG